MSPLAQDSQAFLLTSRSPLNVGNQCDPAHTLASTLGMSDPNGISQHEPGAKLDNGKSKTGLMVAGFSLALGSVAEVTTYGAVKYTPNGWVSVPNGIDRYTDALYRHLFLSVHQDKDQESNLDHLAHACWNLLAIYELTLRKKYENDQLK